MTEIPPGWYPDPVDRTIQRYWDGEGWVGDSLRILTWLSTGSCSRTTRGSIR